MKRKENPTIEESKLAMEMQSPFKPEISGVKDWEKSAAIRPIDETQHETKAISRVSTFMQLAKVSRSARQMFGGNAQWKQAKSLFNPAYRDGLESPPFFITRAFKYKSKEIAGDRIGIEMCFSNGQFCTVGLGFNEKDSVRREILNSFPDGKGEPIGPFAMQMLPTDKGNDYFNIVPYVQAATSEMEIPFVEFDEEIPF